MLLSVCPGRLAKQLLLLFLLLILLFSGGCECSAVAVFCLCCSAGYCRCGGALQPAAGIPPDDAAAAGLLPPRHGQEGGQGTQREPQVN